MLRYKKNSLSAVLNLPKSTNFYRKISEHNAQKFSGKLILGEVKQAGGFGRKIQENSTRIYSGVYFIRILCQRQKCVTKNF